MVEPIEWRIEDGLTGYEEAVGRMERRVAEIHAGAAPELVWLVEHPPLYTAGASARPEDLIDPAGLPVYPTGRGGQYTYHGPGQRVAYLLLDLRARGQDVRRYVTALEDWLVRTLAGFGIEARGGAGRIGVWVDRGRDKGAGCEDKIAAIGVRVRRWVTYHGVALNVAPDLQAFRGIVPCGVSDARFGVTSMAELDCPAPMAEVDDALRRAFSRALGS